MLGRTTGLAAAALTAALLSPGTAGASSAQQIPDPHAGPLLSVLASRSEVGAADGCVAKAAGVRSLATEVAMLHDQGITTTGSLVTSRTAKSTSTCVHYDSSLTISWQEAHRLTRLYGMNFVSHTATYPNDLSVLTPQQAYAETCGSAKVIDAHGLPGAHGLIAYPGAQTFPRQTQIQYGQKCFDFGRRYGGNGVSTRADAMKPPYIQDTAAPNGGPCNTPGAPCYAGTSSGPKRYQPPAFFARRIQALKAGDWMNLQFYVLVTGTSPAYTTSTERWDCTSPDPKLHWTNDAERYCAQDFDAISAMMKAVPKGQFTTPYGVGRAYGRPTNYS